MSQLLWANNAATTLASAIGTGATSLTVSPGTGSEFPSPGAYQYFLITLSPTVAGVQPPEIVKVTARSSDVFTISRAQEGTTAQSWGSGTIVQNLITKGTLGALSQMTVYAGNPNGNVAGATAIGDLPPTMVWDNTNNLVWVCTGSGNAATASWAAQAPLNSPAFTGNPTAATQSPGDNTTRLATTAFVTAGLASKANLAGSASQEFSVATATSNSNAVNLGQLVAGLATKANLAGSSSQDFATKNLNASGPSTINSPGAGDGLTISGNETTNVSLTSPTYTTGSRIGLDGSGNLAINNRQNLSITILTNNTERFRVGSLGQLGIGGANYGASGQALISGGPGSPPSWSAVASRLYSQLIVSSTTWVAPAGVYAVKATVIGGGGGAGGTLSGSNQIGGFGGRGGFSCGTYAVTPGNSYVATIGSGGFGGNVNSVGGAGGTSSFAGALIATGGGGGFVPPGSEEGGAWGANGSGSGGNISIGWVGANASLFGDGYKSNGNTNPPNQSPAVWTVAANPYGPGWGGGGTNYYAGNGGVNGIIFLEWVGP
jgi:hypothetical protein